MSVVNPLQYLDAIEEYKRREITRFVDAHRHCKGVTEITQMKWIAEAMELMAQTSLANQQKRDLVIALYKDMSKDDTNDYKEEFDAAAAIDFVWDASKNRFGVTLRRKGCLKNCLPCCSDVSVVVDNGQVKVGVNPIVPEATPAPPVTPQEPAAACHA